MRSRAGKLVAVLVSALIAASLTWVSVPDVAGAACANPPPSGHWTGSGYSDFFGLPFTTDTTVEYHPDLTMTGTVAVNGGVPNALTGTYTCAGSVDFGSVAPTTNFTGTAAGNLRSSSGTYTTGLGDFGTWSSTADAYVLNAVSVVQPTTIAPGAASSWVLEVDNFDGGSDATGVVATFELSGAGVFGPLGQTAVSQGAGCQPDVEFPSTIMHCHLGLLRSTDRKATATVPVVSTGGAGSSIQLAGSAAGNAATLAQGTDDTAAPVTVSVVAPAALPTGQASGIARPGVNFETVGGRQATPANPITVILRLPKRVAAGSTGLALSKAARTGKPKRAIDGASLMSVTKRASGSAAKGSALGRPRAVTVAGIAVPMSISRSATEAATFCGGLACSGEVVHLTNFSGYNDRKRPAKVTITWDKSNAGRGLASQIFKRGDAVTSATRTLGACVKTKVGYTNTPCISKRKLVAGGDVQFRILVLSGDPKFARR